MQTSQDKVMIDQIIIVNWKALITISESLTFPKLV